MKTMADLENLTTAPSLNHLLDSSTIYNQSVTNASVSDRNSWLDDFNQAVEWMDYCFVPIVFSVGTVGNTLSFLVFVFSHIRRLSSSIYLAALAVSDTGFLFCVFVSWANNVGIHWYHQPGWCQTFVYLGYVFGFLSVWYVVSFTVERYIAVCLPFRRQTMCTVRRAKIVVLILAVFALIAYNFALWTSEVDGTGENMRCSLVKEYFYIVLLTGSIDTVITLVVPCVLILFLNVRIIYAVVFITRQLRGGSYFGCPTETCTQDGTEIPNRRERKRRRPRQHGSLMESPRTNSIVTGNTKTSENRHSMAQVKVTNLLVIVSSAFLLLNLPSHLLRVYSILLSRLTDNYKPTKLDGVLQRFFMYLYYVNFSINFFLYAACGKNFRHALIHSVSKVYYACSKCLSCKPMAQRVTLQLNNIENGEVPHRRSLRTTGDVTGRNIGGVRCKMKIEKKETISGRVTAMATIKDCSK